MHSTSLTSYLFANLGSIISTHTFLSKSKLRPCNAQESKSVNQQIFLFFFIFLHNDCEYTLVKIVVTHSEKYCLLEVLENSVALMPVKISKRTTPNAYTSAFAVNKPVCVYSGAK